MVYEIVIGRTKDDKEKLGTKASVFIGKQYVKMGQISSLANPIYLDVNRSHVVFVCGKRGGGKSYTLGVIAEGISDLPEDVRENLSIVMLDTMGVFWTMKYENKTDKELLDDWGLKPKGLDIKIFTPVGYYKEYKEKGIPTDYAFSIKPSELDSNDWCMAFGIDRDSAAGVLIARVVNSLRKAKKEYSISDIIKTAHADEKADEHTKNVVESRFIEAENWGLFSVKGTKLAEIVKPGQVSVLDVSCYATIPGSWGVRALVIALIAEKLFIERMIARKTEEFREIKGAEIFGEKKEKKEMPLVWLVIDEAHELLPREGETIATRPLITILREGRQPGISLILASQQPGKIHTDVMTQADIVISHRLTAKLDVDALGLLMQSYMRQGLDKELNVLPAVKGAAIIFDDVNERVYPMQVRPRFTWHGGSAPRALKEKKELF